MTLSDRNIGGRIYQKDKEGKFELMTFNLITSDVNVEPKSMEAGHVQHNRSSRRR